MLMRDFYFRNGWLHIDFSKYLYVSMEDPFKTMKKLKKIFKPLKRYFKYTFDEWNYNPVLWCSRPSKIQIMTHDVMWKDKYDTPRYEVPPYIWIHLYKLNLIWYWDLPDTIGYNPEIDCIDDYWEQALWYLYYTPDKTIEKAEETWPWNDPYTSKSTWSNKYLLK